MKRIIFFVFCFAAYSSYSQLTVQSGVSAEQLMAAIIGSGIKVSNVSLSAGVPGAYGTFKNGSTTNLGIDKGIILTNGSASLAAGPNGGGSTGFCNGTSGTDPQLSSINSALTEDYTILEFDFVPSGSNIDITFVFGSEEYPEFVNASYNDGFGIFLSGPGPACQLGYYNNTNVATLPDNVTPVSIDNVNSGVNAAYFVNNTGGSTIQFDGFTTRITRRLKLCPCKPYHLKIAIADAGDCYYDSGVFIEKMEAVDGLNLSAGTQTNVTCFGGSNGSISPAVWGGVSPYSYSWSNGISSPTLSGIAAGDYSLTVTDASGCSVSSNFTITEPDEITAGTSQTDVLCNGAATGTAMVSPAGGTAPYTYSWSPSGGTGATATGLIAGTYAAQIKDDKGCTITKTITITEPAAALTATITHTDITCDNGTNGTVKVVPAGGVAGYSYTWTPSVSTANEATSLPAGTYTVVVEDANHCQVTKVADVIIGSPSPAVPQAAVSVQPDCAVSSGTIDVISPVDPGNSFSLNNGAWQTSPSFTGLGQGSYTVSVRNASGCTTMGNTVTVNPQPAVPGIPQVTVTQPTCTIATGSIQVNNTGYTYSIDGGAFQSSNDFPALSPGTYAIAIKNSQGCTNATSVTILPQPVTPPIPVITSSGSASFCEGNSIRLMSSASNGNQWYANGAPVNGATSSTHEVLTSGDYRVEVTNAEGCSAGSVPFSFTVFPLPAKPVIVAGGNTEFCDGGSVTLEAPAAAGFLWNNQSTDKRITVNSSGLFSVKIKDANNCWSPLSDELRITVNPNPVFTITSEKGNNISRGTSTRLSTGISSGTIVWTPTTGLDYPNSFSPVARPLADTRYQATITNISGCSTTEELLISVTSDYKITLPKVFSPNGDGINDRFVIGNITAYPDNLVQIFDRAGKKVYEKKGYNNDWDGMIRDRPFITDTYFYIIYIEGKIIKKGSVTIVK